jgi:hypothetical protein
MTAVITAIDDSHCLQRKIDLALSNHPKLFYVKGIIQAAC